MGEAAFTHHLRVIRAGVVKNWKLSITYPTWVINRLVGPLVAVALAVYMFTGIMDPASISKTFVASGESASFTGFLILGQTIFSFFMGINWRGGVAIQRERWYGTLEVVFLAPASRVAYILGESLFGLVDSGWTVFLAMVLAFMLFGVDFQVAHPWAALVIILLTLVAMMALGLFFAGFYVLTRAAAPLSHTVQAPVRFFSGASFPLAALPVGLQAVSYALPVTYGLLAVRRVLLQGQGFAELWPTVLVLVVMSAAFAVVGSILLNVMEKRAKRTGTFHAY